MQYCCKCTRGVVGAPGVLFENGVLVVRPFMFQAPTESTHTKFHMEVHELLHINAVNVQWYSDWCVVHFTSSGITSMHAMRTLTCYVLACLK